MQHVGSFTVISTSLCSHHNTTAYEQCHLPQWLLAEENGITWVNEYTRDEYYYELRRPLQLPSIFRTSLGCRSEYAACLP